MTGNNRAKNGFTLIETVIYLALFSIIIGGGMVATFQIIQGAKVAHSRALLWEEGNFLAAKIFWHSLYGQAGDFTVDGQGDLVFATSGQPSVALNASAVKVSGLVIANKLYAGGLPGIAISFTLETMQYGYHVSQDFSSTKYFFD